MTLKQFFQLAGGVLFGLLFYASGLHPLIKWPLIIFFTLLGVALAFLPFEDRPLDKWLIAFFRSVYTPTLYSWQKTQNGKFFQDEAAPPKEDFISPQGEEKLEQYLKTRASRQTGATQKLDKEESAFLSKLSALFTGQKLATTQAPIPKVVTPIPNIVPLSTPSKIQAGNITVPKTEFIHVDKVKGKDERPKLVIEEDGLPMIHTEEPLREVVQQDQKLKEDVKKAQFSQDAAPPNPPTIPNTINGQVMDTEGKIVEGAILEIRDSAGRPVRAVKTNKVGHFIIVTSLANGEYEIVTEKEGYVFEPISFSANGEIIPPIAIRAKQKLSN
ncbi:carboxypeptidase regulatory-like domain-containing protein [Patescibacteria group bacterium]|nr:carboxypeptidase regulatory-like domain-containing protein [Patescibacteria group bacterium]